ncbi:MAG: hypothetical protein H6983_03830 [Ectothiorhodospiraceae bacterium]|nr:hypothetical protein [Chromatiales bacterium]MCP5153271.1 hypothetical protein [Ectothiorhodospiraceae bacterium]
MSPAAARLGVGRVLRQLGIALALAALGATAWVERARLADADAALDAGLAAVGAWAEASRVGASGGATVTATVTGYPVAVPAAGETLLPVLWATERAVTAAAIEQVEIAARELDARTLAAADAAGSVEALHAHVEALQSVATGLVVVADELIDTLVRRDASLRTVQVAGRQLLLIQRIGTNARRLLELGPVALAAADRLGRDALVFGEINNALLTGNRGLGIERVDDEEARAVLEQIGREFRAGTEVVGQAIAAASASTTFALRREAVVDAATALARVALSARATARDLAAARPDLGRLGALSGALAAAVVVLAGWSLLVLRRRVERATRDDEDIRRGLRERVDGLDLTARQTRASLVRVADRLESLADGQLAAEAGAGGMPPVDADEARAVAAIRRVDIERAELARKLREGHAAVRDAAASLASQVEDLARALREQAEPVARASAAADAVVASLDAAVETASALAEHRGTPAAAAVGNGRREAEAAAAAVRDLGACLRRLGDAVEDGRTVAELLEDVSEQAKLLALNVSIQAGSSTAPRALSGLGEQLHGLVERSRTARRRFDALARAERAAGEEAADTLKRAQWASAEALRSMGAPPTSTRPVDPDVERLRERLGEIERARVGRVAGARDALGELARIVARLERLSMQLDVQALTAAVREVERLVPAPAADGAETSRLVVEFPLEPVRAGPADGAASTPVGMPTERVSSSR